MAQSDSTLWWTFPDIAEQRLQSRLGVKVKDKLEVNVTDRLTAVSRFTLTCSSATDFTQSLDEAPETDAALRCCWW